jgi:hypothetical protein
MFAPADARAMLSDFGECVEVGRHRTRGLVNETRVEDVDNAGMSRVVVRRVLVVCAGSIGTPARDSACVAGGRSYRIRDRASDVGEVDDAHEFWELAAP